MIHENATNRLDDGGWSTFGKFVGWLISVPLLMLLCAVTTQVLWGWFIVPAFGLGRLSLMHAYGLALVVGYVAPSGEYELDRQHKDDWWYTPVKIIFKSAFFLGVAWMAKVILP